MRHSIVGPCRAIVMACGLSVMLLGCGGADGGAAPEDGTWAEALRAIKVSVRGADVTAPQVRISTPDAGIRTTSTRLDLAGLATDDRNIARITWSSSSGASGAAAVVNVLKAQRPRDGSAAVAWSVSGVDLLPGRNTITVSAYDGQGNRGTTRLAVDVDAGTAPPAPAPVVDALALGPCVPSGIGRDYVVGDQSGQIPSLDLVPWEQLAAGDTVRIVAREQPYRGKILVAAQGTASAPVRICGVRGSQGERPVIDGQDAVARPGLRYTAASLDHIQETRSVVLVDRLGDQAWGSDFPRYVTIDGLEVRGAQPANGFTNSMGDRQMYGDFGACIWIERGHHVTIADNVIHDCTNGIFSRSTDDGDFAVTRDLRVAGNDIYGNGVVGDEHQHNSYLQSVGVVVEFNRYGPLRAGALGNAIKDRSVGTVIRYNRIEEGAHAIDLVEAEDFPATATSDPAYRQARVYGNVIVKNGETGSIIHYGGDHYGSTPGATWGEPIYRKGTLHFFHNTVVVSGTSGHLFQLSTTDERAEVWNNVFVFAPTVVYPALRQNSEVGASWTSGGVLNLGRNWINAGWGDSDPWHAIPGSVLGSANLLTGATSPLDATTLRPLAGSTVVDAASSGPSGSAGWLVDWQLDPNARPVVRVVTGSAADLGAVER